MEVGLYNIIIIDWAVINMLELVELLVSTFHGL